MLISLRDVVDLASVLRWKADATGTVTLRIYRDTSFEVGAEGIAIGFLQTWVSRGIEIEVVSTFEPDPVNDFGAFSSLFGLYLIYVAKRIMPMQGLQTDLVPRLKEALWNHVIQQGGIIGDSKNRFLVFRDPDYLIPGRMQDQGNEEFPYQDRFRDVMVALTKELGVTPFFGGLSAEKHVVSYLYEASRNAYEHGRIGATGIGVRGIIVQKTIFGTEEEVRRRPCSLTPLRDFYIQNWFDRDNPRKAFIAVTVCDLGVGIHQTLPETPGENPWQRLNRAIFTDATRKPTSDELARGMGLPLIVEAAQGLKAFLLVCAGDLLGFIDHSADSRYPKAEKWLNRTEHDDIQKSAGTSLTLIWPAGTVGGEQLRLLTE